MRKTIYFVHYTCKPGGLEVLLPVIINGIKKYDFSVFVIRPKEKENLSVYKDIPVKVTYGSKNTISAVIKFFFFVLKDRNGIYQLFNAGPYFLFVLRILKIKRVIYSIHGTIYGKTDFRKFVIKCLWKLGISKRTIFISNSEYSAGVFSDSISNNVKPIPVYNPIDVNKFALKNTNSSSSSIKIVYVGRLVISKNLDKWLAAAIFLLKKNMDVSFEIHGIGPYGKIAEQRIALEGLSDRIVFKGHVEHIECVYQNADLLLFLSAYESFGNVAVESILCGTPVIAFNIPSMREIFKEFPQFLIEDNEQFLENIYEKVKHIKDLKANALKARESFLLRFNADVHMEKMMKIYEELG